ncbi:cell division protein ZapA [Terrihabitans sp. B22-R8]|uniref:cell division protein ZapA n=1 Tax=Terrihabitans sp. B22-R8 TaxID=3425128 RepID=UPI00403D17CD
MAEVHVTIAGRKYRMACDDGQEEHLHALSAEVDAKIEQMRASFGEIGDMRLTVMASVVLADELSEARQRIEALKADVAGLRGADSDALAAMKNDEVRAAARIEGIAARLESVAAELNTKMGLSPKAGAGAADALD